MTTTTNIKRIIVGALLSGGVAVAGLGLGAGTAQAANGPHQWCPGQPAGFLNDYVPWDMTVCHTYYYVAGDKGNVPRLHGGFSTIWDGDNPPAFTPRMCGLVPCGLFP